MPSYGLEPIWVRELCLVGTFLPSVCEPSARFIFWKYVLLPLARPFIWLSGFSHGESLKLLDEARLLNFPFIR